MTDLPQTLLQELKPFIESIQETDQAIFIKPKSTLLEVPKTIQTEVGLLTLKNEMEKFRAPDPIAIIRLSEKLKPFQVIYSPEDNVFVVSKETAQAVSTLDKKLKVDVETVSCETCEELINLKLSQLETHFQKKLSAKEVKETIIFLVEHGLTPSQIAQKTGASRATIYRFLPKEAVSGETKHEGEQS